jgi:hypothetical protein
VFKNIGFLKSGFALDWVKGSIPLYRNSDHKFQKKKIKKQLSSQDEDSVGVENFCAEMMTITVKI